jgi:hypothetical protein
MITQKIIKYTTGVMMLAAMAASFTSCKKYLEVEPISSFGPEYVFNSVTNADKAVLAFV